MRDNAGIAGIHRIRPIPATGDARYIRFLSRLRRSGLKAAVRHLTEHGEPPLSPATTLYDQSRHQLALPLSLPLIPNVHPISPTQSMTLLRTFSGSTSNSCRLTGCQKVETVTRYTALDLRDFWKSLDSYVTSGGRNLKCELLKYLRVHRHQDRILDKNYKASLENLPSRA